MSMSSYPSGFRSGALLKEVPLFDVVTGNIYWVDSVNGADGNSGKFNSPLGTIDAAIGKCSANKGDQIHCKPGHTEALSAANGIDFDIAGITLVGHGTGSLQSQVRWTAAASSITIDAANTVFRDMRFTAAFADVAQGIDLNAGGDGFRSYNCLYDEEESAENWVIVYGVADAANDLEFVGNAYFGNDASNDSFFVGAGTCDKTLFRGNHFEHDTAQTSVIAILRSATAMTKCRLIDNVFVTAEPVLAASCVVFTGTANTGFATGNTVCALDADATAANAVSAFDITGMFGGQNYVADTVDTNSAVFSPSDLT